MKRSGVQTSLPAFIFLFCWRPHCLLSPLVTAPPLAGGRGAGGPLPAPRSARRGRRGPPGRDSSRLPAPAARAPAQAGKPRFPGPRPGGFPSPLRPPRRGPISGARPRVAKASILAEKGGHRHAILLKTHFVFCEKFRRHDVELAGGISLVTSEEQGLRAVGLCVAEGQIY